MVADQATPLSPLDVPLEELGNLDYIGYIELTRRWTETALGPPQMHAGQACWGLCVTQPNGVHGRIVLRCWRNPPPRQRAPYYAYTEPGSGVQVKHVGRPLRALGCQVGLWEDNGRLPRCLSSRHHPLPAHAWQHCHVHTWPPPAMAAAPAVKGSSVLVQERHAAHLPVPICY